MVNILFYSKWFETEFSWFRFIFRIFKNSQFLQTDVLGPETTSIEYGMSENIGIDLWIDKFQLSE